MTSRVLPTSTTAIVETVIEGEGEREGSVAPPVLPPAKFHVPDGRTAMASRGELIARIVAWSGPLVVVSAPAGYGKTTLLAEMAKVDERDVAWVSLDSGDDDPLALARCIAGTLARSGLSRDNLDHQVSASPSASGRSIAGLLGEALTQVPRPFVLILDDVHHVRGRAALDLLDGLVDHMPSGCHLVLSGRGESPVVARRRVSADVFAVGSDSLVLDDRAVREVFAVAGLAISTDVARRVVERTEGWPAGVYLSTLMARDDPSGWTGALPVKGSSRFVADYLRHVFEGLPAEVQGFLLSAAALDQLSTPLCEQVIGTADAQQMLYTLERDNLFVVPLDASRSWYRFHSLFREFLLDERARRRPSSELVDLQTRAAVWCDAHGMGEQAVEYLLRTRDVSLLGPQLMRTMRPAYLEGRLRTIDRWLREASETVIESFPPLAILAGWVAALTGRASDAERWAAVAAERSYAGETGDGWASYTSSSAALRALLCADGVESMNRDAELTVELEPSWSQWRNTVVWMLGQARELAGDTEEAVRWYDEALRLDAEGTRRPMIVTPVSRALIAMDVGDWATAEVNLNRALRLAEVLLPGDYVTAGLAHAACARLALYRDERKQLEHHLAVATSSLELATYALPYIAVQMRVVLAGVYALIGDRTTASQLLTQIDHVLGVRPDVGALLPAVERAKRQVIHALPGNVELTAAELRVLPYLPTHLTFAEIGEELFISRHTVHTHAGAIYRKLGVASRRAAVDRARDLGLALG